MNYGFKEVGKCSFCKIVVIYHDYNITTVTYGNASKYCLILEKRLFFLTKT